MNEQQTPEVENAWEERVRQTARDFPYPPTPDIAAKVSRKLVRRPRSLILRPLAAVLVMLIVVIVAVPGVRAAVIELIRVGVVQIFVGQAPTATRTPSYFSTSVPFYESPLDLPGEMSLEEAQAIFPYPIQLLGYPSDLGAPDRVFASPSRKPIVTLVWFRPGGTQAIRFVLELLTDPSVGTKYDETSSGESVQVDGKVGYWVTDAHNVFYYAAGRQWVRQVNANVLVWTQGVVTYRLETDLPLNEALQIAVSINAASTTPTSAPS